METGAGDRAMVRERRQLACTSTLAGPREAVQKAEWASREQGDTVQKDRWNYMDKDHQEKKTPMVDGTRVAALNYVATTGETTISPVSTVNILTCKCGGRGGGGCRARRSKKDDRHPLELLLVVHLGSKVYNLFRKEEHTNKMIGMRLAKELFRDDEQV